jgi:membrane protein DedA with SNARE-associated domain
MPTPGASTMNLLAILDHHGYAVVVVALFVACCGLPLPVSVVLLTAGAMATHGGPLNLGVVILFATGAAQ